MFFDMMKAFVRPTEARQMNRPENMGLNEANEEEN